MEKVFKLDIGGKELIVEAKNLAEKANGNVLVRCGDTLILATCVMTKEAREGLNFFPLTVDYEEKYYAAGKIRGARYIRREGKPSDEAVCNTRFIDRIIRPRFPQNLKRDVQVIATVLSWDGENDPDVLGLTASSIALSISDIPWSGPVSAVRVCRIDNKFVLNPNYEDRGKSEIDIVFAGLLEGNNLSINMIEGSFNEAKEEIVLEALKFSEKYLKDLIGFQKKITDKIGKEKIVIEEEERDEDLEKEIKEFLGEKLEKAFFQELAKGQNYDKEKVSEVQKEVLSFIEEKYPEQEKDKYVKIFFDKEIERLMINNILTKGKRPDNRELDEIREVSCEPGFLPRTHGSGLFSRGQTKSLSILTLGGPSDQQLLEGMEVVGKKRFMHHYNFPPYSVGEIKPLRGPGRREIGHGMLAEKALLPLVPASEDFPYTMRIVSEITSSNGSSSMASVSSSSLALMDAGVPIKRPAAGIAIGIVQDRKSKDYRVLTDIQGPEDHYGGMDFKVAGTTEGITAVQMDVKIDGLNSKMIAEALDKAKKARLKILDVMKKAISKPRSKLSPYAPRILTLQINPEKIGDVIGPKGKNINAIIEETGAEIDIEPSGLVLITAENEEIAQKAVEKIKASAKEIIVNEVFEGKVIKILDCGAIVEILPGQDGMIHISKLAPYRVNKVEDIVKLGDIVSVKVIGINGQGRISLSLLKNHNKKP